MIVCVYGATGLVGTRLIEQLESIGGITVVPGRNSIVPADLYFLCTPTSVSKEYISRLPEKAAIIDFSNAFRWDAFQRKSEWTYGQIDAPNLVLSRRVSVAGCIASSIELALLPFRNKLRKAFITAVVGQSAQGRGGHKPDTEIKHVLNHVHNYEIGEFLKMPELSFVPVVGEHPTGIMTVCQYKNTAIDPYGPYDALCAFYDGNEFVQVLRHPHKLSEVVGTPNAIISVTTTRGYTAITCSIDNLYRGSSSHGIRLMKKMFDMG